MIKLSDAVQSLHRQTTQFVHGVPQSFLDVGVRKAGPPLEGQPRFSRGAYFIGKVLRWTFEAPAGGHGLGCDPEGHMLLGECLIGWRREVPAFMGRLCDWQGAALGC